jgi:hypothetical protein
MRSDVEINTYKNASPAILVDADSCLEIRYRGKWPKRFTLEDQAKFMSESKKMSNLQESRYSL